VKEELAAWDPQAFDKLPEKEKRLFERAFSTNAGDPDYRSLTTLDYTDDGVSRSLQIPKGDILHQFRKDVESGQLPTVSWLAAAQNFSDHPSAPWYGSLYASEIMNILTQNPEVWKKTIFLITFDENDGYFDHVPPFVAPDPLNPETGKCSPGIDTDVEFIRLENELKEGFSADEAREGPIGLGFRVPLIIASPWSRGGQVCSQVYDHTSVLQFLEVLLERKLGRQVKETNISDWRRTVSGDLTAVFKPYDGRDSAAIDYLKKNPFIKQIYNAKFKKEPADFKPLTPEEVERVNHAPLSSPLMPQQERGLRPSAALPYQLYAEGRLSDDRKQVELRLTAGNDIFGKASAGSPFNVYFPGKYAIKDAVFEQAGSRSYAVVAGGSLSDSWPLSRFENGLYHVCVYGPNGFFREFRGKADDPALIVACDFERGLLKTPTGNLTVKLKNASASSLSVELHDRAYGRKPVIKNLAPGAVESLVLDLRASHDWYDFALRVPGFDAFEKRYAGRVETGRTGFSDPAMS
jgi:phospholipase C